MASSLQNLKRPQVGHCLLRDPYVLSHDPIGRFCPHGPHAERAGRSDCAWRGSQAASSLGHGSTDSGPSTGQRVGIGERACAPGGRRPARLRGGAHGVWPKRSAATRARVRATNPGRPNLGCPPSRLRTLSSPRASSSSACETVAEVLGARDRRSLSAERTVSSPDSDDDALDQAALALWVARPPLGSAACPVLVAPTSVTAPNVWMRPRRTCILPSISPM